MTEPVSPVELARRRFTVGQKYQHGQDPRIYLACLVPWPDGAYSWRILLFVVDGLDRGFCFNMDRVGLFDGFKEVP